jgi:hypothetical protein
MVIHATEGNKQTVLSLPDMYAEFKPFFLNNGLLIDQEWNKNIVNGMAGTGIELCHVGVLDGF